RARPRPSGRAEVRRVELLLFLKDEAEPVQSITVSASICVVGGNSSEKTFRQIYVLSAISFLSAIDINQGGNLRIGFIFSQQFFLPGLSAFLIPQTFKALKYKSINAQSFLRAF